MKSLRSSWATLVTNVCYGCGILIAGALTPAHATEPVDFANLSLEQLTAIDVTSVSRRPESLENAPASVFVITADEIRRSGARSLPEALRLAPNLLVARVDANAWAISARGFNNSIGNKLLVMLDGRTIYTPLYSGVFWDAQDIPLADIERIEVVSGPGATLWGTNAMNGVINVITRSAAETPGTLAKAEGGTRSRGGSLRYGAGLGEDGGYRVSGRFLNVDGTSTARGAPAGDGGTIGDGTIRADWSGSRGRWTLIGNGVGADDAQPMSGRKRLGEGSLVARWSAGEGAPDITAQAYYDHIHRNEPGLFRENLDVVDLEFQHAPHTPPRHHLLWGGDYRAAFDHVGNSPALAFLPADRRLQWLSLFAQDEIALATGLEVTAGARLETNVYTGVAVLPGIRIGWSPGTRQFVWAAVAHAVRAPSRLDRDLYVPGQPPFLLKGGPDFESETANAYEAGWRGQVTDALSCSATLFRQSYDDLRSIEELADSSYVLGNGIHGHVDGIEAWGFWRIAIPWRLSAGWTVLRERLAVRPDSHDPFGPRSLGNDPANQWTLRSDLDLGDHADLDVSLRRIGVLPNPHVPGYTAVDAHAGVRMPSGFDLGVSGTNLFDAHHVEFGNPTTTASEIDRSISLAHRRGRPGLPRRHQRAWG